RLTLIFSDFAAPRKDCAHGKHHHTSPTPFVIETNSPTTPSHIYSVHPKTPEVQSMLVPCCSRRVSFVFLTIASVLTASTIVIAQEKPEEKSAAATAPRTPATPTTPDSATEGTVNIGGQSTAYKAIAGTITVGGSDPQDATIGFDGKPMSDANIHLPERIEDAPPTARMFYVAYFKKDAPAASRPIVFAYNGGPGSPTMWLHMGTFGPKRIVTPDTQHQEGSPS